MKQSEVNEIVAQHYQSFLLGKEYNASNSLDSWRGFILHVNQIIKELTENGQ